jgi:threonine/homoserine/homoserine lactone efflux protein
VGVPHSLSDVEWVRIESSPPVVGAARTAASGLRRSLPLVPAELAGYLIAIVTIGVLVNPIIFTLPMLADSLRVAVAIYLGILAIRLWRRGA